MKQCFSTAVGAILIVKTFREEGTQNTCKAQIGDISSKWNHVNGCKNCSDCILLPYNCLIKNPKKANFYSIERFLYYNTLLPFAYNFKV